LLARRRWREEGEDKMAQSKGKSVKRKEGSMHTTQVMKRKAEGLGACPSS
jgi:hypothetical protein